MAAITMTVRRGEDVIIVESVYRDFSERSREQIQWCIGDQLQAGVDDGYVEFKTGDDVSVAFGDRNERFAINLDAAGGVCLIDPHASQDAATGDPGNQGDGSHV